MPKKAKEQSLFNVPVIKEGQKVKWVILREIENWILVNCENGAFTGVILAKEAKELKRSNVELSSGTELELEIINPAIRHEDGYYIVSVTRLLQYDVWKSIIGSQLLINLKKIQLLQLFLQKQTYEDFLSICTELKVLYLYLN